MNRERNAKWIKYLWITLLVLFSSNLAFAKSDTQIFIVKSSNNDYFNQTIQTLINQTDQSLRIRVIDLGTDAATLNPLRESDLTITLGAKATQAVNLQFPDSPVLAAYLTQHQWQQFEVARKNTRPVFLDQALEKYLAFSQALLGVSSIGIVNLAPIKISPKQEKLLSHLKLELSQYQPGQISKILTSIRQATQNNDALLMLPNREIYNRHTLKGVLLTAYRTATPVISYSPAHVKSGALASIYSSPDDIGKHLGELINEYLKNPARFSYRPQFARYFSIDTNKRVAHSLGLVLPDRDEILSRMREAIK